VRTITGDWVALIPVTLSDAEKRCLETIEQLGSYTPWPGSTVDPEALEALEESEFLTAHRRDGALVYSLTETGRLWLKGCNRVDDK
jgi:hypothetical protein